MTQNIWKRTILSGLLVGAALTIEHLLCYNEQAMCDEPELTLFASNVLGTMTIAGGVVLAAESPEEAARHITIAAIGGAFVIALRIIRRDLRHAGDILRMTNQAIGFGRGVRHYGQSDTGRDRPAGRDGASHRQSP